MATTTNFGWPTPNDTDLVKDGAAAIRSALNAVDTSMAELKGGTTGQVLSKTSNTDMDFTWVAQDDSNAIQNAIVDAKGDLIAATANDTPARLAVGSNGQVLTADSTAATGIKWATPAAADSMTLLSTTSITNTGTINVSVSSGYKKLVMYIENFAPTLSNDTLLFRFNSDSSSKYDQLAYQPNYGVIALSHPATELLLGQVNNINTSSNGFLIMEIPNYASTIATKAGFAYLSATYGGGSNTFTTGGWFSYGSTSAISTLNLQFASGNWKAQGTIKIYGVN